MLHGPLELTQMVVGRVPTQPGAYILGDLANRALYIGRADSDLRAQILAHWAPQAPGVVLVPVHRFWYQLAPTAWAAYSLECRWYHDYAPLHNANHPLRPLGLPTGCPICGR